MRGKFFEIPNECFASLEAGSPVEVVVDIKLREGLIMEHSIGGVGFHLYFNLVEVEFCAFGLCEKLLTVGVAVPCHGGGGGIRLTAVKETGTVGTVDSRQSGY